MSTVGTCLEGYRGKCYIICYILDHSAEDDDKKSSINIKWPNTCAFLF